MYPDVIDRVKDVYQVGNDLSRTRHVRTDLVHSRRWLPHRHKRHVVKETVVTDGHQTLQHGEDVVRG